MYNINKMNKEKEKLHIIRFYCEGVCEGQKQVVDDLYYCPEEIGMFLDDCVKHGMLDKMISNDITDKKAYIQHAISIFQRCGRFEDEKTGFLMFEDNWVATKDKSSVYTDDIVNKTEKYKDYLMANYVDKYPDKDREWLAENIVLTCNGKPIT
jgi:hypothetical protein